jgi:hypothetical protein
MKNKSLLIAALLLACFACSEDDDTQYVVAPELETYVNTFISEAQERGVTIPKNNLIAELTDFKAQSVANASTDGDQRYLYVHKGLFDYGTASGNTTLVEYSMFNALGEIFVHNKVVMAQYEREEFFNQLIK